MFENFSWSEIGGNVLDLAKVATAGTPIGAGLAILDAVVDNKVKGTGIDNNEVISKRKRYNSRQCFEDNFS